MYAIESLFLCKKTHIDILEYVDNGGNKINDEHIRMKGIPTPCINYYAEQNISALDVYKQLFDNKTIKFDLINDGNKFVRRNNTDYTIGNVSFVTRTCQYIRDEHDKVFTN